MEGKIITFYSYKGGVGRSMALANIAVLIKRWGYSVLMLDWDLEAPGLENFFKDYISLEEFQQKEGIVDLLLKYTENNPIDWHDVVQNIPFESNQKGRLDLITAGLRHDEYFANVRKFDFNSFYTEYEGGAYIETLREQWNSNYDFVLVDSRTGVTDIGGVCTVQLPDIVVLLFTATEQSLQGILRVGKKINESLKKLPVERYHIPILPIPSRFENLTEFKIGQEWLERFSKDLLPLVEGWLPEEYSTPIRFKALIELLKIPYVPYFSFGEKLPVIEQGTNDTTGIGYAYESISLLLANDFQEAELLFTNREILFTKVNKFRSGNYIPVQYDVFISRKSEDIGLAQQLYFYLSERGLKVFDANQSVIASTDYVYFIDQALINSIHMIVLGSSVENITSPWVEAEWRFFLNRKRSGKAKGVLLTIMTDSVSTDNLPSSLQNHDTAYYDENDFDSILKILNEGSDKNPQYFIDLANSYLDKSDYFNARNSFINAIDVVSNSSNPSSILLKAYAGVALVEDALGNLEQAVLYLQRENKILLSISPSITLNEKLAQSYSKLGDTYFRMGDYDSAFKYFESENILQIELYKSFPDNSAYKNSLAKSYSKLGEMQLIKKNHSSALLSFEYSIHLTEELHFNNPNNTAIKNNLIAGYSKIASVQIELNNFESAVAIYEKQSILSEAIINESPKNYNIQESLTNTYINLGNTYSSIGNYEKAIDYFIKSYFLSKELCKDFPDNIIFKKSFIQVILNLVDAHINLNNFDEAVRHAKENNTLAKVLTNDYPNEPSCKFILALTYCKLGDAYRAKASMESAIVNYKEFLHIVTTLHVIDFQNNKYRKSIEDAKKYLYVSYIRHGDINEANKYI